MQVEQQFAAKVDPVHSDHDREDHLPWDFVFFDVTVIILDSFETCKQWHHILQEKHFRH